MRKILAFLLLLMPLSGFAQIKSPEFKLLHYWDDYDFENPQIFVEGDALLNYFYLMRDVPIEVSDKSIRNTLGKASHKDQIFSLFIDAFRVYLMNPQSYYCDYERYLAVCDFVINDERINKYAKYDFELEKEIVLNNRVGEKAANFTVLDKNDKIIELDTIQSDYLIIFFNNPDCSICMQTKDNLANSVINSMIDSGKMKVLSVCPYDEYDLWKDTDYPGNWLNGYDKDRTINNGKLYYFLESSSIYLLDKDKIVLKKDIRVDMLEEYLETIQ